ncbi:MAG: aminotransferase class I/II-fold pyridoxal phosphate-dependent enzyme [Planctomycetota bacterium]|nr:aminotransferase class I/II-fold pyridoxal phosphate-dependent enzyme [Planctomycetota bacterium]
MSHRSESIQQAARIATRLHPFGETVFSEINRLALESGAVNLGQGCPDFDAPEFIREAARDAINSGHNQYPPMGGAPVLTEAIAEDFQATTSIAVDPEHDITITCGCTEAIAASLIGLLDPGDEVIVMDPVYDSYRPCLAIAGAVPRSVTLQPPNFELNAAAIDAACTDKTKAIMLNTPHNPTGRVFTHEELESLADVCRRRDLIVLSDEVYHRMVYEGRHISIASLPGMFERTVTMNSLGKTFSVTGWKIGWTIAPPHLTAGIRSAHQFLTFDIAHPFQHAAAVALQNREAYYTELHDTYLERRDLLCDGLEKAGFGVYRPQGTYFVLCDHSHLGQPDDIAACKWLIEHAGVAAIPPSSFYADPRDGATLMRFGFCKRIETIEAALERLGRV